MSITIRRALAGLTVVASATWGVALAPGTASAAVAGSPDFAGFCNNIHQTSAVYTAAPQNPYDANSWQCTNPPGNFTDPIDVNAVCRWQYGGNAYGFTSNPGWADSWQCVRGAPPGGSQAGNWIGTWQGLISGNGWQVPATLTLSNDDPITGRIEVPAYRCGADWTQTQRTSDTERVVHAHVTPPTPKCVDNDWNVTISSDSLEGKDLTDDSRGITFTRS